jgi:hypothetical protein
MSEPTITSGLSKAYKKLHGITYNMNVILILTTMKVSNLTHVLFVMNQNCFRKVESEFLRIICITVRLQKINQ